MLTPEEERFVIERMDNPPNHEMRDNGIMTVIRAERLEALEKLLDYEPGEKRGPLLDEPSVGAEFLSLVGHCSNCSCQDCREFFREYAPGAPVEPPAPQWDINSIERIARQQGVFGGREGNTVTITGPIMIDGPALNRNGDV